MLADKLRAQPLWYGVWIEVNDPIAPQNWGSILGRMHQANPEIRHFPITGVMFAEWSIR